METVCRHKVACVTCRTCCFEPILFAQSGGILPRLPKDVNKIIFAMVERCLLIQYCVHNKRLYGFEHECTPQRDCDHRDLQHFQILNVLFFGSPEELIGFNYGFATRFSAESELFYFPGIEVTEYYMIDDETVEIRDTRCDWTFKFPPEVNDERSRGILTAIRCEIDLWRYRRPERDARVGHAIGRKDLDGSFDEDYFEELECEPCEVIFAYSERVHVPKPKVARVAAPKPDTKCQATTKKGPRCSNKAKLGGYCSVHSSWIK